jgi:hypothetical protein
MKPVGIAGLWLWQDILAIMPRIDEAGAQLSNMLDEITYCRFCSNS